MEEIWKDIPEYEGIYQASNLGRIRSLDKIVDGANQFGKKFKHTIKGKVLKPRLKKTGYLSVHFQNIILKEMNVHRVIAITFLDRKDFKYMPYEDPTQVDLEKLEVNHKDENKLNNHVDNLEWCTKKYNCAYGTRGDRIWEKRRE